MLKSKKGESLVGIVIGMFILGFALVGIINILTYNHSISSDYESEIYKYIIKSNSDNIIKKIDTSSVSYEEDFYIYKDEVNKEFKIYTGTLNEDKVYVDKLGKSIDPVANIGKTYKRTYNNKIDVLKHSLSPDEIPNLVFHFDANNTNGLNNATINNGDSISTWSDLTSNGLDATGTNVPTLDTNAINGKAGIVFNGTNDILKIDSSGLINNDGDCYANIVFEEKSYAIVLKTGMEIEDDQAIYEQGGKATGYNFMIHEGDIYAGIHNKSDDSYACTDYSATDSNYYYERDSGQQFKSVNLGEAIPDTTYFIMIVQDSTHSTDAENKLQIFMNGILVDETDRVDPQPEHWKIGLGGINERNVRPRDNSTIESGDGDGGCNDECLFFQGTIGEFISWNHALSVNEVRGVQNYFNEKWLGGNGNIFYNIIQNETKKYNN